MKKTALTILCTAFLLAFSSTAQAQDVPDPLGFGATGVGLLTSTTSYVSLGFLPLTTTVGVIFLLLSPQKVGHYLDKNERNLRDVAALGTGDGLGDLGAFLQIPKERHKALGAHLRKHHKEFGAIMAMAPKKDKGEMFLYLVSPFLQTQVQK